MKEKGLKYIAIIDIFFPFVIEVMLMNVTYSLYHFNPINSAGLFIFVCNMIGLLCSNIQKNKKCFMVYLLLTALSFYQIIAIDAIGYRYLYLVGGVVLFWYMK